MRSTTFFVAAALAFAPAQLLAQPADNDQIEISDGEEREDDGNSRLGLLGLLGLAGLLGLRRREPDIHVDARRDNRAG